MPPRIALVHAMRASIDPIAAAFARLWPEADLANLLDDALPGDLERSGGVDEAMERRFVRLAEHAVASGAAAILFSCSAFGNAIEAARAAVRVPVLKPNEAMLEAAVDAGGRVALLATFAPTLTSMIPELEAEANRRGLPLDVVPVHVPGALEALSAGDGARHDALVAEAAAGHREAAVVVLTQFSMARAAPRVSRAVTATVLTTPDAAVTKLRQVLRA